VSKWLKRIQLFNSPSIKGNRRVCTSTRRSRRPPEFCRECGGEFPWTGRANAEAQRESPLARVEKIINRFHLVARQLRSRHADRATLVVEDEYDVQDLLHALLKLEFDDIRPEEWTPSYAGSCSRMDFLLKAEQVVIEVKKTSKSVESKQIGDQLLIDVARYATHPDCRTLVCFIYDPEGRLGNPSGLKRDLEARTTGTVAVLVHIRPE